MFHRDTCVTQNPKCESVIDRGFGPTPNDAGDELGSYDSLTVEHENQGGEGN